MPATDDAIIDMSDVRFFGAAAITVLMDFRARLHQGGHTLQLAAVPHVVRRTLDLLALLDVLPCWPTTAEATAVCARPLAESADALKGNIAEVAVALGIPATACWCEVAEYADAYLALAERAPDFPDQDLALLWDEHNGWSIAMETNRGEDLVGLAYLGADLLPDPQAVTEFVHAILTGEQPGHPTPPQPRRGNRPTDLTARVLDLVTHQSPLPPREMW